MFIVAIVGSRSFKTITNYKFLKKKMDILLSKKDPQDVCIISGGARGADTLAQKYANAMGYEFDVYEADWSLGKKGGPLRNAEMANDADAVVAFMEKAGTRGTQHMISVSKKLGKPVRVYSF